MKKIIFLTVLGILFSGVSMVMADSSVKFPATFTLKVAEKATVENYLNTQIKLQKIEIDSVTTLIGFEPGQSDPNTVSEMKSVVITVTAPGECGPNADPRCLGMPAFEESYTLYADGDSVSVLALKIKANSISSDSATFTISMPSAGTPPPNPAPIPGVSSPGSIEGGHSDDVSIPSTFNLPLGHEIVSTEKIEATPDVPAYYEVKTKRKARLFFIFPVSLETIYSVNSETGESKVLKRSWWNFLAL